MGMLAGVFDLTIVIGALFVSVSTVDLYTPCNGQRVILTEPNGTISAGHSSEYPGMSRCEWLIDAGQTNQTIMLQFVGMETECSYDILYVFDGNSFNNTLLASLSGNTLPEPIVAKSGYMLIYFFMDGTYHKKGFEATYKIDDCPNSCNNQGSCVGNKCHCKAGYWGDSCHMQICPNFCIPNGMCNSGSESHSCVCNDGYTGIQCDLSLNDDVGHSSWYHLSPSGSGFTSRTSHSGVFVKSSSSLWVFGGYTGNDILNDLSKFCLDDSRWEQLPVKSVWPSARSGHAATEFEDGFFIFGGNSQDGSQNNELWYYNTVAETWILKATNSSIRPPKLTGHSLTNVEGWIYLFGGKMGNGTFSSSIFRINATSADLWEYISVRGGKEEKRRLIGHSAVYHKESKSLLIFGGYTAKLARFDQLTDSLHTFHIEDQYWSEIQNQTDNVPGQRAFHSAVIFGNYMVIYGGNAHKRHSVEMCYDSSLYLYHLGCHVWVKNVFTSSDISFRGRFGHAVVGAYGNILMVAGGYTGYMLGDLIAYKFPPTVAPPESHVNEDIDYCLQYENRAGCSEDCECIWCQEERVDIHRPGCVHRSRPEMCTLNLFSSAKCVGICSQLKTCYSCLSQGRGPILTPLSPRRRFYIEKCSWCVKQSKCQRKHVPEGTCASPDNTDSGLQGWWSGLSRSLTDIDQCQSEDFPAGLQWIQYRPPMDIYYPDKVEIVQKFPQALDIHSVITKPVVASRYCISRFVGYIHPLNSPTYGDQLLRIILNVANAKAKLNLSRDSSIEKQEEVASVNLSETLEVSPAIRHDGSLLFTKVARGYKYYVNLRASHIIPSKSSIDLQWNGAMSPESTYLTHPFTLEFLEPYRNGECEYFSNCMACLTDAACAWCSPESVCVQRENSSILTSSVCQGPHPDKYLITSSTECPVCADYIDCYSCTNNLLCEWVFDEAVCIRRGRYDIATRLTSECLTSCHLRTSCKECMLEKNECMWCMTTNACSPVFSYVSTYLQGQCRYWINSHESKDFNCWDCSIYKSCNSCLTYYGCGWCGNTDDPNIGRCVQGDFSGPSPDVQCSHTISQAYNMSVQPSDWSYGICPDVEECLLGYHDCHLNATCHNTFHSYTCTCNPGFIGNGRTDCVKTCDYECIHGECAGAPHYVCRCNFSWTGPDCNTSCGCNGHSTCKVAVGICDKCQHLAMGVQCQLCQPGSYGDSKSEEGCQACDCNGHGNQTLGECDVDTGECFCIDNTMGPSCEVCIHGYYGDPRTGESCYLKCENRLLLTNITQGSLGSHDGKGVNSSESSWHAYCLWILTDAADIYEERHEDDIPTITMTVEHLNTDCVMEYMYVYDGIPSFIHGSPSEAVLLGAFCGPSADQQQSVIARSGILTVYFEADKDGARSTYGFNASYHVNRCVGECAQEFSQMCIVDECSCVKGFSGPNCTDLQCPANCSFSQNSTSCLCTSQNSDGVIKLELSPWMISSLGSQLSRFGHTITACGDDSLFMFGGFSLEHGLMNDIWQYNVTSGQWHKVTPITSDEPSGTYQHAAACIDDLKTMYIFGGFISLFDNPSHFKASNQFWQFTVESKKWTRLSVPTWVHPLVGHTMNQVEDTKLIVIGGISTESYYSDKIYEYDASSGYILAWQEYSRKNDVSGAVPAGLYAHSAVYHKQSNTIYAYGGQMYKSDRFYVSDDLYTYDVEAKRWNQLQPSEGSRLAPRMFHTAVDMGEYMVVIGNRTEYPHFTSCLFIYHYKCNFWHCIQLKDLGSVWSPNRLMSLSAAVGSNTIYIMGGFDNLAHSELIKLTLPSDPCTFYSDVDSCISVIGCSACHVTQTDGQNKTVCFSSGAVMPEGCLGMNATVFNGTECSVEWHINRECEGFKHCSQCLAVYPQFKTTSPVCQWCTNCPESMCIPQSKTCDVQNKCNGVSQQNVSDANQCLEHICLATDCDKCLDAKCMWTQQIARSSEIKRLLSLQAAYNWTCVMQTLRDSLTIVVENIPPDNCPARCYTYRSCIACLSSRGSEGGAMECMWSEHLQECLPPAYIPIHCSGGECGSVISGAVSSFCSGGDCDFVKKQRAEKKCPRPCWEHKTCASCVQFAGCGWCAFSGLNGKGVCMAGGLKEPTVGLCSWENVTNRVYPLNDEEIRHFSLSIGPPVWSYINCPPENECTNDNHNCNLQTQNCTDLLDGFICSCKNRYFYNENTDRCQPECHQGCVHGRCISPDVCQCDFGWVGNNCSVECQCNRHSNCESVTQRKTCLQCRNNTQGDHCEQCKPYFVGDPRNGGTCKSCAEFCNNHSNICRSETADQDSIYPYLHTKVTRGSTEKEAICIDCQDNTVGPRCDKCKTGYFRLEKLHKHDPCVKCQCNGHSDACNKVTGEGCVCMNNTHTQCGRKDSDQDVPCWMTQCATCKENYIGTPTNGHQCYRQMKFNQDYCFDPETQNECSQNAGALHMGRTVFFVIQPKYLNVDIRVTIDVTQGGADVYFSPRNDTFVVDVEESGVHDVQFDKTMNIVGAMGPFRNRRSLSAQYLSVYGKREAYLSDKKSRFNIEVMPAEELNTFITVEQNKSILIVRDVHCRLVITLPLDKHDLQFSKFYMVIYGKGGYKMNETFGNLYFRQDQPHIDLFVFFSVFFSCFFLFLALCVVMWKMKQVVDTRRSRQQRAKEMLHMASRPFAKVLLLVEPDILSAPSPSPLIAKKTACGGLVLKSHPQIPCSELPNTFPLNHIIESHPFDIVPIAVEPTDDGIATVGSVIFQLPGGYSVPSRLCLGSTLTMRIQSGTAGLKINTRHRPASSAC